MKDINTPTKKRPKHVPSIEPRKHPHDVWIRLLLGLGTLLLAYILSQIL